MPLETATHIHQLNAANPSGSDRLFQGDDHIRLLKAAIKATFPNITGPVTLTHTAINALAAAIVPFGAITLWYGASGDVPAGWAVCDGSLVAKSDGSGNITVPDLRGKVAIGANGTYVQGSPYGQTTQTLTTEAGGVHSHTAGLSTDGSHTHTATSSSESPGVVTPTIRTVDASGTPVSVVETVNQADPTHDHDITVAAAGGHTHTATIADSAGHTHGIAAFSVVQPSLALHYIIKI